jgi:hypothetical protein
MVRCSLGAAFEMKHHPDFVTFPKSLADFFADRAKALLEIGLDAPCVATGQAMVVTSCHDMGCTRDARGWLYSGMLKAHLKRICAQGLIRHGNPAHI